MDNLKIDGFHLATNLITKLNQVTYDKTGCEENDYFDITKPENTYTQYVISFYKDCELTKMLISDYSALELTIKEGIAAVWSED